MTYILDRARAHSIKRDVIAVYLAARDPRTPWYVKALALAVAAYALSPIDLIPDFIPVLGLLDDLVLVPIGIAAVVRLIPAHVMEESRQAATMIATRPVSRMAGFMILCLWAALFAITAWLAYRYLVIPHPGQA
jgi:uncharacterized membrane protein YkvA (DUF1232 family)